MTVRSSTYRSRSLTASLNGAQNATMLTTTLLQQLPKKRCSPCSVLSNFFLDISLWEKKVYRDKEELPPVWFCCGRKALKWCVSGFLRLNELEKNPWERILLCMSGEDSHQVSWPLFGCECGYIAITQMNMVAKVFSHIICLNKM